MTIGLFWARPGSKPRAIRKMMADIFLHIRLCLSKPQLLLRRQTHRCNPGGRVNRKDRPACTSAESRFNAKVLLKPYRIRTNYRRVGPGGQLEQFLNTPELCKFLESGFFLRKNSRCVLPDRKS